MGRWCFITRLRRRFCTSNQTASLIWQLCDGKRTAAEMIGLLSEFYPESAGEIADDVQSTLQQFAEQGCVELV